jgi:Gpi18-like mannosyltransferase
VVASRVALLATGHLAQRMAMYNPVTGLHVAGAPPNLASWTGLAAFWTRWDANWYLDVVTGGYRLSTNYFRTNTVSLDQTNVAFFPLWPNLLWLTAKFLPLNIATLLLPNLLLLIGTVSLHEFARLRFDRKVANMAVISACCFPGSFVFSSAMTESLFFVLGILTFRYLNSHRWLPASFCAALMSTTRVNGLTAGCALGIGWLHERLTIGRAPTLRRELLAVLLIPIPLCLFMTFLFWRFGDAFAAFNAHLYAWPNNPTWPFANLFYVFHGGDSYWPGRLQSALALLAICIFILEVHSFTIEEISFVVLTVLVTTSTFTGGLYSITRYLLPLFPIHLALALAGSRRDWAAPVIPCLAIMNGFLMVFWSQGAVVFI